MDTFRAVTFNNNPSRRLAFFRVRIFLCACLSIAILPYPVEANFTGNVQDIYDRLVEEFEYRNYEKVVEIYESGMTEFPVLERMDSPNYYSYAKAVEAFGQDDLAAAKLYLDSLPDSFEDTVYFRYYLQGLTYEKEGRDELALEAFRSANGIYDSSSHIAAILKKPSPSPAQPPLPEPAPIFSVGHMAGDSNPSWPYLQIGADRRYVGTNGILAAEQGIGLVRVTQTNTVNVRAYGTAQSEWIGEINPGEQYVCTGIDATGWYKILYPTGQYGYVSNKITALDQTGGSSAFSGGSALEGMVYLMPGSIQVRTARREGSTGSEVEYTSVSGGLFYPCIQHDAAETRILFVNVDGIAQVGYISSASVEQFISHAPGEQGVGRVKSRKRDGTPAVEANFRLMPHYTGAYDQDFLYEIPVGESLPFDQVVTNQVEGSTWYRMEYNGVKGYVNANLIEKLQ